MGLSEALTHLEEKEPSPFIQAKGTYCNKNAGASQHFCCNRYPSKGHEERFIFPQRSQQLPSALL